VSSHTSSNNCADIGLKGVVNGVDGLPKSGITLQYGEENVSGSRFTTTTDSNGRYGALLLPGSNERAARQSHTWYVTVIENGDQASQKFNFTTDPIYATNPSHCRGVDPDDEDEFQDKGCLIDPCKIDDAIQIKTVNWQVRDFQ
jgi:hypothetical protein